MSTIDNKAFTRYSWFNLAYLLAVILWGAWVRITGSGAGCGSHWPTCNGEILPHSPTFETFVEFTHRATSGLSLPIVLLLVIWAFKVFPGKHLVRYTSLFCLIFLLFEAALGAGLVKFDLVAHNTSVARAITASIHLVNTFLLCGFAVLTAWWSNHPNPPHWKNHPYKRLFYLVLGLLLLTSMAGAVTALGDTLFPPNSMIEEGLFGHLKEDLGSTTHFLVRLRIIHPLLAICTLFFLFFVASFVADKYSEYPLVTKLSHHLSILLAAQFIAGIYNILLGAPGWMQLCHLLLADLIWINCILLMITVFQNLPIRASKTEVEQNS